MTNWKVTISGKLPQDLQSSILRKHYIKKEPFSKIIMHEMYLSEMIEDMKDINILLKLNTASKEIAFLHIHG